MIGIRIRGDNNKTSNSLRKILRGDIYSDLDRYGQMGVTALSNATPVESGLTANSWAYRVIRDRRRPGIEWYNTSPAGDVSVAVLIQYGHATRSGTYIAGYDFINPTMRPIFDQITDDVWKRVVMT